MIDSLCLVIVVRLNHDCEFAREGSLNCRTPTFVENFAQLPERLSSESRRRTEPSVQFDKQDGVVGGHSGTGSLKHSLVLIHFLLKLNGFFERGPGCHLQSVQGASNDTAQCCNTLFHGFQFCRRKLFCSKLQGSNPLPAYLKL